MASNSLEEKINKIRQKNEEIRRRHEEVEADKQNAAKLNALVKMVPPTDWPERKEPPEFSNPPPPRSNGNSKPKASTREYRGGQQQYHAGGGDGKKIHVFAEGDGPPPDPTYNFLADSEREERNREDLKDNERSRGRGGPLRGSSRRRGGGREGYSKEYRGSAAPKDATKPEYEAWRAERNRIDEARISRQRTAEGNWRREWDNNKINVEEHEAGATKSVRLDIGDVKKDHKEYDKWQADGNDYDSSRGRGGKQYISRGAPRGSHNNRAYQHSNSFEQFHGSVSPLAVKSPVSPNGVDERTVVATDKSIKVIVNHGSTIPKGPVMSVKVSSASIAGTGRVGPRQKPRILYSSQSETEAVGHEHERFSGPKSPDDKTNHVSFNRDIDEQQRYVPKSPHPQRKAEINSKSPYLTRKEFKYDSQQQRHGEIDPKSPYLHRKEIKDCPMSPHFQKKVDFTHRDSHIKQRNNHSANDSFKPIHSQRRTSEKTKHDLQKFPVPKKLEDASTPKPQRTNKRTDKSKNFQNSNLKETQESGKNESNSQTNDRGTDTVKESTRNIANGDESQEELSNTNNNCTKEVSDDFVPIQTVKENQNENDDVSKLNISLETSSPSIDLGKVDESVPDDTTSNDNSEPVILAHEDVIECQESMNRSDIGSEKEVIVENVDTKTEAESTTPHCSESTTDECNETVEDVESSEALPGIASEAQEKVEAHTIIESNTDNRKNEITNIDKISEDEPKQEQNLISLLDPNKFEQLETEAVTAKSELQSEISLESEKIINKIEQTRNIVGSTSVVEKEEELSRETETHLTDENQVSNDFDNQVVKDLVKLEQVSNDVDEQIGKDAIELRQVSNGTNNQIVEDSTKIEQISNDIDHQVGKDPTKLEQVPNDIDEHIVKDSADEKNLVV